MSVIFMWCGWLGSPRKLAQPTTRTIPLAHDSGLPRVSGEGRLRASMPASFRHKTRYSSSRYIPAEGVGQGHDLVMRRAGRLEVLGLRPFALGSAACRLDRGLLPDLSGLQAGAVGT